MSQSMAFLIIIYSSGAFVMHQHLISAFVMHKSIFVIHKNRQIMFVFKL